MRRVLTGVLPFAMAVGALFATAPAASAAPPAASVHPASASCPSYGPGSCKGTITITVTRNGHTTTVQVDFTATGFTCHEQVTVTVSPPGVVVGSFTATCPPGSHAASVSNSASSPYTGSVAGQITLPAGLKPGEHSITALGTQSGVVASTSFMLTSGTGSIRPCTASASNVRPSGIVLDAAYLSAQCKTALPAAAGGPPSSGSQSGAITTAPKANASQLPFTGFNAATAAAAGAILVGAGGALVLSSRRRRRSAWE